jgi:hypothetical protein
MVFESMGKVEGVKLLLLLVLTATLVIKRNKE